MRAKLGACANIALASTTAGHFAHRPPPITRISDLEVNSNEKPASRNAGHPRGMSWSHVSKRLTPDFAMRRSGVELVKVEVEVRRCMPRMFDIER